MKSRTLTLFIIALAIPVAAAEKTAVASKKPNVVVIMVDDLGSGDVSCLFRNIVGTPNIDRLAKTGVKFTSGYVTAPICAPSRAGMFTGIYQQRYEEALAAGKIFKVPFVPMSRPGEAEKYADQFPGDPLRADVVATIVALDQAVGRILDKLKQADVDQNTVVFFTGDNGGHPENRSENTPLRDEALYFGIKHRGNSYLGAVRQGDWKLVLTDGTHPELYNLSSDLAEKNHLASVETERVAELTGKWKAWQAQMPPPDKQPDKVKTNRKATDKDSE